LKSCHLEDFEGEEKIILRCILGEMHLEDER
jgi:hypothetical protein